MTRWPLTTSVRWLHFGQWVNRGTASNFLLLQTCPKSSCEKQCWLRSMRACGPSRLPERLESPRGMEPGGSHLHNLSCFAQGLSAGLANSTDWTGRGHPTELVSPAGMLLGTPFVTLYGVCPCSQVSREGLLSSGRKKS